MLKNLRVQELLLRRGDFPVYRTMEGAALVEDRVGITFDIELCVPWDAPEAVVDINSEDVVTLGSLPDKVGLFGRSKDAAASRILQGRDSRSIRFLVPDVRGVDQNFHDVTIVDMDEEREPKVTAGDLTHLRDSWPPGIFNHMKWFQQDLELMRKEAKREFTQARPMPCKYCGKVQHVPSRGQTSSGSGTVVEVSGIVVYRVERFTTRLYGTLAERSRCSMDIEDSQHRTICPTLDSASGSVDGVDATRTFGNIDRYSAFQRTRDVADTPLQGLPRRVATRCLSIRLHDEAPCPLVDATKYDGRTSVATGNRTRGDTQICKAVTSAFPTGERDVGGGW